MLGTFAMVGVLLTGPSVEKINFTHTFTAGQTTSYDLTFDASSNQGDMKIEASYDVLVGDKSDKGTTVTMTPKKLAMNMGGQAMDQTSSTTATKLLLDQFGMPETIIMDGPSAILTIPFLLSYLPNKELEVGDTFNIDWKGGDATYKGTGKFEGLEEVSGKTWPKLSVKAILHPGTNGDGELTYSVYFDKEAGKVVMVKGQASVDSQDFKFVLTKK